MVNKQLNWRTLGWPVYLALALLVIFAVLFLVVLFGFQPEEARPTARVADGNYGAIVADLLVQGDAAQGDALLEKYTCVVCHRYGVETNIAPALVGINERAAERRPPMSAAEYIYESIVHPTEYVVEGYPASMLQDFGARIPDQELGSIIAYLLTPDAH
jgi:hypothetical protein